MKRCPSCGHDDPDNARLCPACGEPMESLVLVNQAPQATSTRPTGSRLSGPSQVLAPHTVLDNRYRIVRALKTGGMGAVYLASDSHLGGRMCAIKEMIDGFPSEDARRDGQLWFAREAQMLGRLRHDCIPEIYDYFIESGRYYLSLEYIAGENLEDRVARLGTPGLPELQVLDWAAQICDVLLYLHGSTPPIVFRDLKPANVMVTAEGSIRLVDFGIARVFSPVRQNTMIGTPGYCPPEQYQGMAEPLSDLYSLAATMHHLLTGRDPRDSPPFSFPAVRTLNAQVSLATESLLEGALRVELGERGPSIQEFGRALRRIANELSQGLTPRTGGSMALNAPGDPLPPTRMAVPFGGVSFGRLARGTAHTVLFPISNEGPVELRAVLRASVPWIQVPDGQLRVPCGSTVRVPLRLDASSLASGVHAARIDLEGNGGAVGVPVEARVVYWLNSGSIALLAASVAFAVILAIVAHLLLAHT